MTSVNRRTNRRVCVYCGRKDNLTLDHVPPKLLLAKPYPDNLITVPACRQCNASFQSDDEYTRFAAAIDFRAARNRDAQSSLPAILRSLERPNAKAFAEYLAARQTPTLVLDGKGAPMGREFEVDRTRINATGERMVRALFFVETGIALAPTTRVRIAANPGVDHTDPAILQFARVYKLCSDHRDRAIGTAFSYVAGLGQGFSVWLMMLYDYFIWMATIQ